MASSEEEMTDAANNGDLPRVVEIELEFHRALCSAANNGQLYNVFRLFSGPVGMALSLDHDTCEDVKDIAAEHHPLLEAVMS